MGFIDFFRSKKNLKSSETVTTVELLSPVSDYKEINDIPELTINPAPNNTSPGLSKQLKISEIKRARSTVLSYDSNTSSRSGEGGFVSSPYDLVEVGMVDDVESFVRQANWKKLALMYKEGYDFIGKNPQTIQYIETRLAQIARASKITTNELLRNIGSSLVRMSNAFLVINRDVKASAGKIRRTPEGKTLKPIAAIFPVPAETMRVKFNDSGDIVAWKQEMPDGRKKEYSIDDVLHFTIRKKDGFVFGSPDLIPVLDDIRALRNIEENIELLLHKHLFPLFQYIVGTPEQPAGVAEDGTDEIETVKQEIEYMPAEGGLVTPERHKIEVIGAQGKAIDATEYILHFKRRVIAGLGISEIDLGVADTANKGTSRTLSRQLIDTVKDVQDSLEEQFNMKVISELLLESTFMFDTLDKDNKVQLKFREIDLENRIEQEKHAIELFNANGITYTEFRTFLGKEPIITPEDLRDNDKTKYPDWHQTKWKLFGEPELIIKAIDEPWTGLGQSLGSTPAITPSSQKKGTADKDELKPKSKISNSIIDYIKPESLYSDLTYDVLLVVKEDVSVLEKKELISQIVKLWIHDTSERLSSIAENAFITSANNYSLFSLHKDIFTVSLGRKTIRNRCNLYITRLGNDIINAINFELNNQSSNNLPSRIGSVLKSFKYRETFTFNTEVKKADSYGRLIGMKISGANTTTVDTSSETCEQCAAHKNTKLNISDLDIDSIPPFHPNCECKLVRR